MHRSVPVAGSRCERHNVLMSFSTFHRRQLMQTMAVAWLGSSTTKALSQTATTIPRYDVVHGWPILPPGEILGSAAGVDVDSHGAVFVFHRAGRTWSEPLSTTPIALPTIAVFDGDSGKLLRRWGQDKFAMPHGLTIDRHDNVWVTDVALQQVFKFSPDGRLLLSLGERAVAGNDAGHFNRPTDIAALPDGSFYVSDGYLNTRVVRFSPEGKFVMQWGRPGTGPGEFNTPHAVKVDSRGQVYVADRENDRVQVFTAEGRFLSQWRSPRMGRPYSLVLLDDRMAVVVDGGEQPDVGPDRSGAALVTLSGKVVSTFGRFGNYDGQFRMAHDVAADRRGNLYIVDITGQRVQKFAPSTTAG
jgi:peptidylamidoglycolate lyase